MTIGACKWNWSDWNRASEVVYSNPGTRLLKNETFAEVDVLGGPEPNTTPQAVPV